MTLLAILGIDDDVDRVTVVDDAADLSSVR
jgi:hypothetical protein